MDAKQYAGNRGHYYTIYDKNSFTYPNSSYGVMSWWDYGHMITYIAQRIPNANPFQAGVSGPMALLHISWRQTNQLPTRSLIMTEPGI